MRNRPESTLYNIKKGKAGGKHNALTQGAEEMTAKTQQRPAAASSGKRQEIGFLEFEGMLSRILLKMASRKRGFIEENVV